MKNGRGENALQPIVKIRSDNLRGKFGKLTCLSASQAVESC